MSESKQQLPNICASSTTIGGWTNEAGVVATEPECERECEGKVGEASRKEPPISQ